MTGGKYITVMYDLNDLLFLTDQCFSEVDQLLLADCQRNGISEQQ